MTASTELVCIELFHVYLDAATSASRITSQIEPTVSSLMGLLASTRPRWRPLVVIDDYFATEQARRNDDPEALCRASQLERDLMRMINCAWGSCWEELQRSGAEAFAGPMPPIEFVRESAFQTLACSLAEALVPRLRPAISASVQLDGSGWRRAPWIAGPIGAWLANGRPPRSAPPRRSGLSQLHSTLDPRDSQKHSIHLDVELFDCDRCRLGGRCDGFGSCDATVHRRPDLRLSCPLLAAALHVGRHTTSDVYGHDPIATLELRDGEIRVTGTLEPASRIISVLDGRFLEVEHAVGVILDHLAHNAKRPT